jgi:hypothetical protein
MSANSQLTQPLHVLASVNNELTRYESKSVTWDEHNLIGFEDVRILGLKRPVARYRSSKTFRRVVLPSSGSNFKTSKKSARSKLKFLFGLHFNPENVGRNLLRNVDERVSDFMSLHSRLHYSSQSGVRAVGTSDSF